MMDFGLQLSLSDLEIAELDWHTDWHTIRQLNAELKLKGLKRCPACGNILSVDQFGKNSAENDGRCCYCLSCFRKHSREYNRRKRQPQWKIEAEVKKRQAIELLGGQCARCGYNEFQRGLSFHHVNPATKATTISNLIGTHRLGISDQSVLEELDKCILLCRNCHAGLHAGEWEPTFVKRDGLGWTLED